MLTIPNHVFTNTVNFFNITDPAILKLVGNITHPNTPPLTISPNSDPWDLIQALSQYAQSQYSYNIAEHFFQSYLHKHPSIQALFAPGHLNYTTSINNHQPA